MKITQGVRPVVLVGVALSLILFSASYAMEGFFRPSVGEIKGSPPGESRVAVTEGGALLLYNENGKILSGFPVFATNSVFVTSPLLLDMYGDGMKEIAVVARDVDGVYSVYLYNGIGEIIAQDSLGEKSVYYDLAVLKSGMNNKKNFVLITEDGSVLEFSLIDGSLVSQEIFSIGYAGSIAVNNAQNKIYVSPLNAKIINIYSKVNDVWGITSSITTTESIIYPVEESNNGRIFAINYNGELVAYNIMDGQLIAGFPVAFDYMPVGSPILSELDSNIPGIELVVLLSNGRYILLDQNGVILNNNFSQGSFLSTKIKILGAGPDELSPELVSNLIAEGLVDGISLTWDLYPNIDGDFNHFNIYRNTTSTQSIDLLQPIKQINDVGAVSYFDESVEIGEKYYYTITVVDNSQNESDPVNWVGPVELFVNVAPTVDSVEVLSDSGLYGVDDDLTVSYNLNDDNIGQEVKPIIDWQLNNSSIAVLNMPFEADEQFNNAKDYSTYANIATIYGNPVWSASGGHDGFGTYEFDGVDDYLEIEDVNDSLDLGTEDFTISTWIKRDSFGNQQVLMSKKANVYFKKPGWLIRTQVIGQNDVSLDLSDGVHRFFITSKSEIKDNDWHHLVFVIDRDSQDNCKFYLDGVDDTGTKYSTVTSVGDISNDLSVKLGDRGDANKYFNGVLDSVQIYDRALSLEQIQALHNNETNKIVSQETGWNESWQACVTPNDGKMDGAEVCSNEVAIE